MYYLNGLDFLYSMVGVVYATSCLAIFAIVIYHFFLSLPSLIEVVIFIINSLLHVIGYGDKRYWCNERFIDLAKTLPRSVFLFMGAVSALLLIQVQSQVSINAQLATATGFIVYFIMCSKFDILPDSQELLKSIY